MKKICLLLIALLLTVAVFAACDKEDSTVDTDTTDAATTSAATTDAEPDETEPATKKPTADKDETTEPETEPCTHLAGDWIVDVPAMIGVEGSRHKECTLCGDVIETETTAALIPSEGLQFDSNGNGTCRLTGIGTCTDTNVVIPLTSPEGWSVTAVGNSSFYCCGGITSVTIPDSVTFIGDYAFHGCSELASVVIPDSVTSIGERVFEDCPVLRSIVVDGNNSVYQSAGNCLIETASKTLIAGCKGSVIPSDGSVTSIGVGAFEYCESLTSIEIPDSVTTIGDFAFFDCDGLTSVTIGNGVTSMGVNAFARCINLESVTIANGVTVIGNAAFEGCGLTGIVIPDSVTSIGRDAFDSCMYMKSVTIGKGVTSIGKDAFNYCTFLSDVYYTGTEEEWAAIFIDSYNECLTDATIHYNYVP